MFNIFKKNNDKPANEGPRRFFSVLLSPNLVQAAMWEAGESIKILGKSSTRPYFNDNDLLVKLDQCLQDLGPEGESVHQTLFHLDSSFVMGSDISPEKKDLFQKMTETLQLESLGFVTNTESVVNAKLDTNPEITKQLVIEFTPAKTIYSLYDGKSLLETIESGAEENFAEQFKGIMVQLAGKLGTDYTSYFAGPDVIPDAGGEPLVTELISGQITSEEMQTKLNQLPETLPLKSEVLGSEIILSYILVPSATIIARSYGWLKEPEPEPVPAASVPPEEPVAESEPMPVLSRQKAVQTAIVPKVEETDFEPVKPKKQKKPLSHGAKMGLVMMILIILMIAAVAGVFWWLVQSGSATVTLEQKSDFITKTLDVIIDPDAKQADYDKSILPGTVKSGDLEVEIEYPTTGTKNIGEKATGKVEIINKTNQERTLAKGLELENGTVSFILNDEIHIDAAKSEETSDGKKIEYSKKDANVTAVTIGTSGNIKSGTSLRVGASVKDDLEAVAKEDFSGGTDKTVKVFSKEDQEKALELAEEELASTASDQIEEKKGKVYQVPQLDEIEIVSSKFDAEIDEETDSVQLTVKATVPVIAFDKDEFLPLAEATVEKLLPEGYVLDGDVMLISTVDEKKTARGDGQIYVKLDLTQNTVAVVDVDEVKQSLLGQSLSKVDNILKNYTGVGEYSIAWSTELTPKITGSLPSNPDKLKVVIAEEE